LTVIKEFPKENKRSILFMVVNIFFGTFGFAIIQTFLSSYSMTVLHYEQANAGMPFLIAGATLMVISFPAALLANKIGRRLTMMIGCAGWVISALLIFLVGTPALFVPLMILTAAFYGLWYVNSFVTLIDAAPNDKTIGSMTALTTIANMAGMSAGPALTGVIIEAAGYNYGSIFLIQGITAALAFLALIPVKKGEIRTDESMAQEALSMK